MGTDRKGSPGSVSTGTLRNCDLVSAFGTELESLDPSAHYDLFDGGSTPSIPKEADGHDEHEFWASEAADRLVERLIEVLNERAPEGYYFGAHPGDGADFGFWQDEESL